MRTLFFFVSSILFMLIDMYRYIPLKDIIVKTTDKAEHDDAPETNVRLILETTAIDFLFST